MNKSAVLKVISSLIVLDLIIVSNISLIVPILIFCLSIIVLLTLLIVLVKSPYVNGMFEKIGVGLTSGLIVSLYRDISNKSLTYNLKLFYVSGFLLAFILLFLGITDKVFYNTKSNKPSRNVLRTL